MADIKTRTVWSATVVSPNSPTPVATLHSTEEEAIESLRDNYDPEGEYENADIVEELQTMGYFINVDVHEI